MPSSIDITCKLHRKFDLAEKTVVGCVSAILKFSGKTRFESSGKGISEVWYEFYQLAYPFSHEMWSIWLVYPQALAVKQESLLKTCYFWQGSQLVTCSNCSLCRRRLKNAVLPLLSFLVARFLLHKNMTQICPLRALFWAKTPTKVSVILKFPLLVNKTRPS